MSGKKRHVTTSVSAEAWDKHKKRCPGCGLLRDVQYALVHPCVCCGQVGLVGKGTQSPFTEDGELLDESVLLSRELLTRSFFLDALFK